VKGAGDGVSESLGLEFRQKSDGFENDGSVVERKQLAEAHAALAELDPVEEWGSAMGASERGAPTVELLFG